MVSPSNTAPVLTDPALRAQWEADTTKQETALREVQEALGLAGPPARIECYDISNTQGTAISASRVVFVQEASVTLSVIKNLSVFSVDSVAMMISLPSGMNDKEISQ